MIVAILIFTIACIFLIQIVATSSKSQQGSIFDFSVENSKGEITNLIDFKGEKAYIIVNVASKWGLTKKNYKELQEIFTKYKADGLQIIAFPCNDFGSQEPACNSDIQNFVSSIGITFPVMGKLECNSKNTSELYKYLTSSIGGSFGGLFGDGLRWNFHKFLCDADGKPVKRYGPLDNPLSLANDIESLLGIVKNKEL